MPDKNSDETVSAINEGAAQPRGDHVRSLDTRRFFRRDATRRTNPVTYLEKGNVDESEKLSSSI